MHIRLQFSDSNNYVVCYLSCVRYNVCIRIYAVIGLYYFTFM